MQIRLTASGEVADYTPSIRTSILEVLAFAAGLTAEVIAPAPSGSRLDVTAGSVNLVASFPVESSAAAATAVSTASSALASAEAISALFSENGVTVIIAESGATVLNTSSQEGEEADEGFPFHLLAAGIGGGIAAALLVFGGVVAYRAHVRGGTASKSTRTSPAELNVELNRGNKKSVNGRVTSL